MRNYRNVVVVVEKGKQENNRNVLGVLVELKKIEMWLWWRENNRSMGCGI